MSYEFKAWPKIPRLSKMQCSITEKLDGTNASIHIAALPHVSEGDQPKHDPNLLAYRYGMDASAWGMWAGSRTRWISPENDNFGFAKWAQDNSKVLFEQLGPGTHYGEWWGQGIQRTYGLTKKYFTLFNPWRYGAGQNPEIPTASEQIKQDKLLGTVPILSQAQYSPSEVGEATYQLETTGSVAVPGWMKPEGIVVYIGKDTYKVVINGDENKRAGA